MAILIKCLISTPRELEDRDKLQIPTETTHGILSRSRNVDNNYINFIGGFKFTELKCFCIVKNSRFGGQIFVQIFFFISLLTQICFAQWQSQSDVPKIPAEDIWPFKPTHTTHLTKQSFESLHPSFYDRKSEWKDIIKKFWGPGDSLLAKLAAFDLYQSFVRANYCTFLYNPVNWDSLASFLRSRINDSTSRGEFSRILNDMAFALRDGHAYAIDSIMVATPLNPGTPILVDGGTYINHFGAGLTPLSDSSMLVYKVVPNHPLGLVPGDRILGYQGVPWHKIVWELLEGGVPHNMWFGAAPSAFKRALLRSAGESWHLFDTIDVIKYTTGQTVHLPLDAMVNLEAPNDIINNEQMPIPGIPMPVINPDGGAVTYGIIEGTNIGYIYIYHYTYPAVSSEFDAAVLSLMGTDGLIIDLRLNWGGTYGLTSGISRIMNYSTNTVSVKHRCSPNDFYSLCPHSAWWWQGGEIPTDVGTYYDRPIAVLLGPNCASYGDLSSWQFSYVPNAKMFGRSPSALYSGQDIASPYRPGYIMRCPNLTIVDYYNPEIPPWGQEYPGLEEVWLTPDGAANSEDDVVNRAIEWINNLVYPHDILSDKTYYQPGIDSVHLSTIIENPNSHQLSALANIKTIDGAMIDSVNFEKQTSTSTSEKWTANFNLPASEEFFNISVTVFDETESTLFAGPNAARFTTAGPATLDSISFTKGQRDCYYVKPYVRNEGVTRTITDAKIKLICNDLWLGSIGPKEIALPNIAPGEVKGSKSWFTVSYIDSIFPGYFNFKVEVMSDSWTYWTDSTRMVITDVEEEVIQLISFKLEQNYPNPFNPTTKISYAIPLLGGDERGGLVTLKVYDVLGREVATLVNKEQSPGVYEVEFSAKGECSGVYFYKLLVGNFMAVRKMLLLR